MDKSTSDGENIGTTRPRHRPLLSRQGRPRRMRCGWATCTGPTFRERVEHIVAAKNRVLAALYPASEFEPLDAAAILREYSAYAERLRPYVGDTTELLLTAAEAGKRILFEGAQGRCSTSTTAPTRSSPAATARASASRTAPACRAGTSTASSAS